MIKESNVLLSICISTFNRAAFIGATLESIISQVTNDCEIVVLDGGSTDNTEQIVAGYTPRFQRLRYVRQDSNNGVDQDFDRAVELARGDYCWLFSDDDLLKPGAVAAVLEALRCDYSLVLVNGEYLDFSMRHVHVASLFGVGSDKVYAPTGMDGLFEDVGTCLICICCIVIKRSIWIERERARYYGSRFIHVGVIFQEALPGDTLVIAKPFMSLRRGNEQTWGAERFQVWYIKWPSLVWSLALSKSTKRNFCDPEPWRRFRYLLALRATGEYTLTDYHRWIRPRLRSFGERMIPFLVVRLSRDLASCVYVAYSLVSGAPRSPRDVSLSSTMFPASIAALVRKERASQ